ncbi:MAG: agmatinase [Methanobacterium sp.]|uniref:agmatinase n=1 Tax=Methanobacterium sp. TaxID=2164 RepID=UPI003D65CC25|nr:agmatinase [Methanobacterium sp.]
MLFYTQNPLQFAFSKIGDESEISNLNKNAKNFGIIGAPFDSTSTYKTGARFGPKTVREASYNFERYNMVLKKTLDANIYDFGDIEVIQGNFKKTSQLIESTVSDILEMSIIPIVIGGEHTVSYGVLKAMDVEDITIIHFDAHMDLRDEYMGEKYSHATVMRRIMDLNPKGMIQIGLRSSLEEEIKFARENQISYFTSHEVNENLEKVKNTIKKVKGPIYLSLDIDMLDPAYAPNVGTPSPCGLNPFQLESLIHSFKGKEVVGFDLVEVSSTEIGNITSINGAKAIYDFLSVQ